jgi:hypothetical protein
MILPFSTYWKIGEKNIISRNGSCYQSFSASAKEAGFWLDVDDNGFDIWNELAK